MRPLVLSVEQRVFPSWDFNPVHAHDLADIEVSVGPEAAVLTLVSIMKRNV